MFNNQLEQGGVVVSRWAHNSKVGGSKPLSATFFCFLIHNNCIFLYKYNSQYMIKYSMILYIN